MLQQPHVGRELGRRGRDAGQRRQHLGVLLARVGLAGDREHPREAHAAGDAAVELGDLLLVAVEQVEEAGLCPGGPLDAPELQRLQAVEHLLRVEEEVLHPQRDAFAHGGQLRGLKVRVREAGDGAVAACDLAERDEHRLEPPEEQLQAFPHQQQVRVVGDVRAGGPEVQEATCRRRLVAQVVDVRHDVVTQPLLVLGRAIEVDVVDVRAELLHGGPGNVEPQLALPLHQGEPQPSPQPDAPALAPQRLHRRGGVPRRERRDVAQTEALARAASLLQSFRN